ncbi:MAG: ATP-binding protein [Ilumatobacteraceae bacterium]
MIAVAAAALAAVAGAVLGAALAVFVGRRRASTERASAAPSPGAPPSPVTVPSAGTSASAPRWNDVVDRLSLGVVVAGSSGRVHHRNRAARALAGTHIGLLVDDTVDRLLAEAVAGRESHRTLELYGPPRMAVVVTAVPLTGGGAVATIEDVSERRRVDAVRTDFVANISHELKTPVGALAVLAEALAAEDDPDVVHRVADRVVDEAHRLSRTIDDLLELSRIELGEEPLRDLVDVADIVSGAIARARQLAEIRVITVELLEVPVGVRVLGDRRQLVSALGNLVENAVKYSERGSTVQVRVRIEGASVELMVADHGIGIPAQDHDRIFERFYRVDKGRGRDTGGTGLGLSIVRHVATNHRGDVLVSSLEGEGSTFVLRLPLADVDAGAEHEAVNR